jgi:hypothetical protein
MATVTIEEAVSLSCNREPVRMSVNSPGAATLYEADPVNREFERRLKIAVNHAQATPEEILVIPLKLCAGLVDHYTTLLNH